MICCHYQSEEEKKQCVVFTSPSGSILQSSWDAVQSPLSPSSTGLSNCPKQQDSRQIFGLVTREIWMECPFSCIWGEPGCSNSRVIRSARRPDPMAAKAACHCHHGCSRKGLRAAIFHTINALLTPRSTAGNPGTALEALVKSPETELSRRKWKVITATLPANSMGNQYYLCIYQSSASDCNGALDKRGDFYIATL